MGLPAFMMVQVYASTLRECGETLLLMKAGVVAVLVNLFFTSCCLRNVIFPEAGCKRGQHLQL